MQCSVVLETDRNRGNVNMKTLSNIKNPYKKESNLDNIVDQLCTRLEDIKDRDGERVGMPTCSTEHTEAVRRYYAAFPALKKGQESSLQYYLPPPAWCRKSALETKVKMQSDLPMSLDWNSKNKKYSSRKERRDTYNGHRKNRKRCTGYSRSFDSKESLPEWVTHEGVWDMETQDPVKEFIRAIALDEGYGTCENTVTDELKEITQAKFHLNTNMVPDWDDSLDLDAEWVITEDLNPRERTPMEEELYAKFEAKFDRSIEALWSKDQNTPDDEYQDLPIDFHDLLSSPSDHLFADPAPEKRSLVSLAESIWSTDAGDAFDRAESPTSGAEVLHDRFRPLTLGGPEPDPFLYEGEELDDALSTVARTLRSFATINHSRDRSGFVEVPPARHRRAPPPPPPAPPAVVPAPPPYGTPEDLLISACTHFCPIQREGEPEREREYADGDTFDVDGELDVVEFQRSESGGAYFGEPPERYLEYRASKTIDYGRLNLTEAQRCPDLDDPGFRLRFPLRQRDAAAQTEVQPCGECGRSAKRMRPDAIGGIWTGVPTCDPAAPPPPGCGPAADEREWEELLRDISAAHQRYVGGEEEGGAEDPEPPPDRKRRHERDPAPPLACSHPHARFLHCAGAHDRPLTR